MLCELVSWLAVSARASSRNLGPIFVTTLLLLLANMAEFLDSNSIGLVKVTEHDNFHCRGTAAA